MPVDVDSYRRHPTTVSLGNFNGGAFVPNVMAGPHRHYTAANCRVTLNPKKNVGVGIKGVTSLDPQPSPAGDTYFLPFATNEIASIVLPPPAPGQPQSFLTTNLSGCMIYVDRVNGVPGSIVVYHANNEANAPAGRVGGQYPIMELPACTTELNRLYNQARANLAAAPYGLNLVPVANVGKPSYNAGAWTEVQRKTAQARMNVEFTGGTMVFGRVNGGSWELFWTTYGSCEYDRPANAPKGWFGNGHRNPTTSKNPDYRVLGSSQFF